MLNYSIHTYIVPKIYSNHIVIIKTKIHSIIIIYAHYILHASRTSKKCLQVVEEEGGPEGLNAACSAQERTSLGPASSLPTPNKSR